MQAQKSTLTERLGQIKPVEVDGEILWEAVEMALDYGRYCGLGQWRNGGYGRFVWKRIEDKEAHE